MSAPVADIEGYAAMYGVADASGDEIAPGAFAASLAGRAPRMLYQHAAERPVGRWRAFEERADGLYAYGEIALVGPDEIAIHGLIEAGALDGLSIGFRTARAEKTVFGRRVLEAALWEVSLVTFPMAPGARILRVGAPRRPDPEENLAQTLRAAAERLVV